MIAFLIIFSQFLRGVGLPMRIPVIGGWVTLYSPQHSHLKTWSLLSSHCLLLSQRQGHVACLGCYMQRCSEENFHQTSCSLTVYRYSDAGCVFLRCSLSFWPLWWCAINPPKQMLILHAQCWLLYLLSSALLSCPARSPQWSWGHTLPRHARQMDSMQGVPWCRCGFMQ